MMYHCISETVLLFPSCHFQKCGVTVGKQFLMPYLHFLLGLKEIKAQTMVSCLMNQQLKFKLFHNRVYRGLGRFVILVNVDSWVLLVSVI